MNRDTYVAWQAPDWSAKFQRFSPLTHTDPQHRAPMAVRRTVSTQQVENLKARWFAFGAVTTAAPILIAYGLIRLLGGA